MFDNRSLIRVADLFFNHRPVDLNLTAHQYNCIMEKIQQSHNWQKSNTQFYGNQHNRKVKKYQTIAQWRGNQYTCRVEKFKEMHSGENQTNSQLRKIKYTVA